MSEWNAVQVHELELIAFNPHLRYSPFQHLVMSDTIMNVMLGGYLMCDVSV